MGGVGAFTKREHTLSHIPWLKGVQWRTVTGEQWEPQCLQQTSHWDDHGAQVITGRMMHLAVSSLSFEAMELPHN